MVHSLEEVVVEELLVVVSLLHTNQDPRKQVLVEEDHLL
tara:strand:+ start:485 stop:601 length:117 start_codon:yes stop_codon:yes gene_type:complete